MPVYSHALSGGPPLLGVGVRFERRDPFESRPHRGSDGAPSFSAWSNRAPTAEAPGAPHNRVSRIADGFLDI
jgi:hypothetical protein